MKIFTVFFTLFLCGLVNAQNFEFQILNSFLLDEIKNVEYDSIHVIQEPINVLEAIALYEKAYNERDLKESENESVWLHPSINEWPLNQKDILLLKKKAKRKRDKLWSRDNLENQKLVFKSAAIFNDYSHFMKSHVDRKEYILKLSRPLLLKNKKIMIFYYDLFSVIGGFHPTVYTGAILLIEHEGEWRVLTSIKPAIYS